MKVIDHQPHHWFLFEDDGSLFLDANCDHSFFGYCWMIKLNTDEISEYKKTGREYLSKLATEIHDTAPILKDTKSRFKDRDVTKQYKDKIKPALDDWFGR